jgi:hypothetical protein
MISATVDELVVEKKKADKATRIGGKRKQLEKKEADKTPEEENLIA